MCRPLLRYCLENQYVSKDDIKVSFWPTTTLPADVFVEPCTRLDAAVTKELVFDAGGYVERVGKQLFNKAIGFMISVDEPLRFIYRCSTHVSDRPPNSTKLPEIKPGFHEWVQVVEQRSYDSLRPIHAQILQISRMRMHKLARYLRLTISGFRPQYLVSARTDAWHINCPKNLFEKLKKLKDVTYATFGGVKIQHSNFVTKKTTCKKPLT